MATASIRSRPRRVPYSGRTRKRSIWRARGKVDQLDAAFSPDGTAMVLVRESAGGADLYVARWDGRVWSKPQPIDSINTDANERGPALSRDGRQLYFASDREGGAGGYDIYSARWNGSRWGNVRALPGEVNSASNELAPALSADGSQLFFDSDRDGKGKQDIFVSGVTATDKKRPSFAKAEPVDGLNTKAADVQAAITERGDHVFLASDRDRSKEAGFKVYLSRVVDGETLPPEQVDLYIDQGDVTDPAVRMEGFDLLFSSDTQTAAEGEGGFQLFRSTTREVITYTDLSRWMQFKELMGNIAWWILLAIAAVVALIYLLEKWRDITSLYHKCLAGSVALHLIALLIAMFMLIAKEINEDNAPEYEEVVVNLDALAEEELALESVPQETQLTETAADLQSEKMESEFGATGFEAQEPQPVQVAAATAREAVEVEVQPAMSTPIEVTLPETPVETSMLNEFAATALPEIDTPLLEERDPSEPVEAADTSLDEFTPAEPEMLAAVDKAEREMQEEAVEATLTPTEVTELQVPEPLADAPKESAVETAAAESAQDAPADAPTMEPMALDALPELALAEPAEFALEEPDGAEAAAVDKSADTFSPDAVATEFTSAQAQGSAVADNAMSDAADAGAVPEAGTTGAESAIDGAMSPVGAAASASELPPADLLAGVPGGGLPEMGLEDLGSPSLEEPAQAGEPAETGAEAFEPTASAAAVASSRAESSRVADTAVASDAPSPAAVSAAPASAAPAASSLPTFVSAISNNAMPLTPVDPSSLGALPEAALPDPGAPVLEEPAAPGAAPANATAEKFEPAGGAVASLTTDRAQAVAAPDTAASGQSDATAVAAAARVTGATAIEARPPEAAGGAPSSDIPPPNAGPAKLSALPDIAMTDTGAPMLEEPGPPGGAPAADSLADQFKPEAGAVASLETARTGARSVADAALVDPTAASAIAQAGRDSGTAETTATRPAPEAAGLLPELAIGALPTELGGPVLMPVVALPGELDAPKTDPGMLAKVIQKQRGKPSIEVIEGMGGSKGSEEGIAAAMEWLSKNQEPDGRWDTRKHGATKNHDHGGTGLALLCFYGWGERHDQKCKYQDNVRRGIEWLVAKQRKDDGYLGGGVGMMYSHAIATIALCEAYGVTKDPKLKAPAERAIAYSLNAQSKTRGGWRYSPGDESDTSVTGWQYMAMHSARMAGLQVPDENFERARRFLDAMGGGKHGGLYGYQERGKLSRAMVATGMFCRQLDLVPPTDPKQQESARLLKMHPMKASNTDLYYVYYATLALYQHQGSIWNDWNEKLQEILPLVQKKTGAQAGSWDPSGSMTAEGGRVVSTALSTLSLEVYYRLLPMYGFRGGDAPERKERVE